MGQLDDMARGVHQRNTLAGQHVAMTGVHARDLAARIIDTMQRDMHGKALVTGGTQST